MKAAYNHSLRMERGFTLIELMVVVVIVAILMGIALPSYQDFVRRARRSDAMSALMDVANRQEQFMLDHNSYTADMIALGFAADPMLSAEGNYTIDAVAGPTGIITSYELTATPINGSMQADDDQCASFTLTSTGAKTAKTSGGTSSSKCW